MHMLMATVSPTSSRIHCLHTLGSHIVESGVLCSNNFFAKPSVVAPHAVLASSYKACMGLASEQEDFPHLDDVFCSRQELLIDAEAVLLDGGPEAPLSLRRVVLIEGGQCGEGPNDLRQLCSRCQDLHAMQQIRKSQIATLPHLSILQQVLRSQKTRPLACMLQEDTPLLRYNPGGAINP